MLSLPGEGMSTHVPWANVIVPRPSSASSAVARWDMCEISCLMYRSGRGVSTCAVEEGIEILSAGGAGPEAGRGTGPETGRGMSPEAGAARSGDGRGRTGGRACQASAGSPAFARGYPDAPYDTR
ncbi:hypothetical protein Psi01_77500 [Planobispora siamensis]|uniref:Uncharacterized protein n=1 Tax=Planobispora siamensis TaxID=936338 RepID=A0A8J3SQZ4_9ACTN|nr:hypothetical protein Psi01_77500 [Planobispora siamensis]